MRNRRIVLKHVLRMVRRALNMVLKKVVRILECCDEVDGLGQDC